MLQEVSAAFQRVSGVFLGIPGAFQQASKGFRGYLDGNLSCVSEGLMGYLEVSGAFKRVSSSHEAFHTIESLLKSP